MRVSAMLAAAAIAVALSPAVRADVGGSPTCRAAPQVVAHTGTWVSVPTCAPYFLDSTSYVPARYTLVSGSLPPGRSLWGNDLSAAQIDGTPTQPGTFTFAIAATDRLGRSASASYTVQVVPALLLKGSFPKAVMDTPYAASVSPTGGVPPYAYSFGFPLAGLTLDAATGAVTGTLPFDPGLAAGLGCGFSVSVTDAAGTTTSNRFSITAYGPDGQGPYIASCAIGVDSFVPSVHAFHFAPTHASVPAAVGRTPTVVSITPVRIRMSGPSFLKVHVTRVTFGGTRAVFSTDAQGEITAIPPVGARTGRIVLWASDGRTYTLIGVFTIRP